MRTSSITVMAGLMVAAFALIGCRDDQAVAPAEQAPLRIVSLSPAISRTLVDLGVQERVIGRTPFCNSLDVAVPAVGDLLNLDYERLVRLRPTHVLVQPQALGIDRQLLDLAHRHGWEIGQWRLNDIGDVKRLLADLPDVLGRDDLIERAVELEFMIDDALRPDAQPWRGRVLLVAGIDPVGAFGVETYLHDVLTALGASNAVELANYPQLSLEDIVRLNPQAIVLVRPGAPNDLDAFDALRSLGRLEIDAVRDGRVAVLTHEDAFMPSSGIIGVAEELRLILQGFDGRAGGSDR